MWLFFCEIPPCYQRNVVGASKGTPDDEKCVTKILGGDKNKELGGQDLPFCFKGFFMFKCSKTHLKASLIPKFSTGGAEGGGKGDGRAEVVSCLSGVDAPGMLSTRHICFRDSVIE